MGYEDTVTSNVCEYGKEHMCEEVSMKKHANRPFTKRRQVQVRSAVDVDCHFHEAN
ncbi:hypothetical protein KIN20_013076 [Parelaphostrongylus tenuis]|uniref:Uncharacterized protein n=1 Tax=Parelaphostrongylus tenuis TaxID=148309 RepID=A0AAD5MXN9_PARTN|nr:hypothetical protein KIN20_013076 [Parelaphostrongylus tenuis]